MKGKPTPQKTHPRGYCRKVCWTLVHHGIATAIASDFLNRKRNRKEFPQREANLAIFHRKMHRNRNRIVTAEKSQPISRKESLRTI